MTGIVGEVSGAMFKLNDLALKEKLDLAWKANDCTLTQAAR